MSNCSSMALWRIINRSYLKYASNQLTRNYYTQVCLASTHVVKETTKLSSFDIPNSDICTRPSNIFLNLRFLATSAQVLLKKPLSFLALCVLLCNFLSLSFDFCNLHIFMAFQFCFSLVNWSFNMLLWDCCLLDCFR